MTAVAGQAGTGEHTDTRSGPYRSLSRTYGPCSEMGINQVRNASISFTAMDTSQQFKGQVSKVCHLVFKIDFMELYIYIKMSAHIQER